MGDVPTLLDLEKIVAGLLGILARLVGIAVFVMLIIGGFNLLTAGGDPKKAEKAQKTITGAVAGIAIVVGGWFLLQILEQITGAKITILDLSF